MNDKWYRYALGFVLVLGGMSGYAALLIFRIPTENRDAVMLALGIILGWGQAVVAFEFGSTSSGRALSAGTLDIAQRATSGPSGKPSDPVTVRETKP